MKKLDEIIAELIDVIWALQDYPQFEKEVEMLRQIEDALDSYIRSEFGVSEVEMRYRT